MNFVTLALLISAVAASFVGTLLMIKNLRNSVEGYEDETGFHYGRLAEVHAEAHAHRTAA
ncbi:MAG: hypothetical protein JWM32_1369 [Verrucomicrobia bacterium]|nr:hypothetical protein [Verrucomicrobiota bacterium]